MSVSDAMKARQDGADSCSIRHRRRPQWLLLSAVLLTFAAAAMAQITSPNQPQRDERRPAQSPIQSPIQTRPGAASEAERTTAMVNSIAPSQAQMERASRQFMDAAGLSVEQLIEAGLSRRADLLAARQRLAAAEGRVRQAGLRPNPEFEAEYGSARFLAGEPESELDIGISQTFETGGKRGKRTAVARLELQRTRFEVLALERQYAAEVRLAYARAVAAGRQLDALEQLIGINEELLRVTNARLNEGDVAPVELNLVRVETARLRVQAVRAGGEFEGEIISLRSLAGFEMTETLRIAPLPERPPRLDLNASELTEIALRERVDLQAARLGEELGTARIRLAQAQSVPNVAASVRFSRERSFVDVDAGGIEAIRDMDNALTFGIAVEIPVFNRNQGEIAAAAGERIEAERQREFMEATIRRDVALAHRRYRAAAETLVLYSTQIVPRTEEIVRSVRAAYGLGEFSIFDVLNEQRRLIESETGYNEALRDYYTALAELERALGTPLPATGFAAGGESVLPATPASHDLKNLRRSIESVTAMRPTVPAASLKRGSPLRSNPAADVRGNNIKNK